MILFYYFLKETKFFLRINEKNWEKKCFVSLKKKNINLIRDTNKLGKFYISQGRYVEANIVYEKVYALFRGGGLDNNVARNVFNGLALVAQEQGDFDLAIEYIKRGEIIRNFFSKISSPFFSEKNFLVLSKCYSKKGDKKKTKDCFKKYYLNNLTKKEKAKIVKHSGEIFLEFFNYKKAEEFFKKAEINFLELREKAEAQCFLSMALLGEKKYTFIRKMSKKEHLFRSNSDVFVLFLYSSAMADVKQKKCVEARKKLNRIFNIVTSSLNNKEFYKFYYYNFLFYYGLGTLSVVEKKNSEAIICFQKILEIVEIIPSLRYKYIMERVNIYFFKLLAIFELIKIEKNINAKKAKIKTAKFFLKGLTKEERQFINLIEVGNEGSVINKINNLK